MSTNTRGRAKKSKSARKYPESSGMNPAGLPVASQLDNVEERPVIPPSRMAPQAEPAYHQHYGDPALPGSGYTFPGPATSHPSSSMPIPTSWDPMSSQLPLSAPRQSAPSSLVPDYYDSHHIDQPELPQPHFPLINIYHHPADDSDGQLATNSFEYTRGVFITEMDETVLHRRRPLRFSAAPYPPSRPERQITEQPTIAPYAQLRAGIAECAGLTKLRPGELVRGSEFSAGVVRVIGSSFRDVRKRSSTAPRLPPAPRLTATRSEPARPQTTINPQPGPSTLPLVNTVPAVTQPSLTVLSKNILNQARDATKRYVLNTDAMPTRPDLLSILTSAAFEVTKNPSFAQEWVQTNEVHIKKLSDNAAYIRSAFKDYAAHNVQDAFQLREATAVQTGLSEGEWKRAEVSRLLRNFMFLSAGTQHPLDANSGNTMISTQIVNLVSNILYLEGHHLHVDATRYLHCGICVSGDIVSLGSRAARPGIFHSP